MHARWRYAAAIAILAIVVVLLSLLGDRIGVWPARAPSQEPQLGPASPPGAAGPASLRAERIGAESVSFLVRDLADGRPVAGLRIRAREGVVVTGAETDVAGGVTLPVSARARCTVDDPNWAAMSPDQEPLSTGTYWVYAWIELEGVVRATGAGAFAGEKCKLKLLINDRHEVPDMPSAGARDSVVAQFRFPGPPSSDGSFKIVAPRVHGLTVAATARGWKPAWRTVDVSGSRTHATVELYLERAFRVRGLLRSTDGTPLHRVPVTGYSLISLPASEITPEQLLLLQPEGGVGASSNPATGRGRAKFLTLGQTDDEGHFDLSIPIDGEVVVVAYAVGHRPVEVDLGTLRADIDDLDLAAEPVRSPSRASIVAKGKPLARAKVLVVDLSLKDGDVQPGGYVQTDGDGRIRTDWLIPGRRYFLDGGEFAGHLIWKGQDIIDIGTDLLPVSELPQR